jgi:hypothetical protein
MAVSSGPIFDYPFQASPNAAAVTWSGNPPVPAGGIPQYAAVVIDVAGGSGDFDVIVASANTQPILGINQSQQPTGPGATVDVRILGVSKALASAAITQGQFVAPTSSGQLAPLTSLNPATTATNTYAAGIALTAATGAGDLFSVLLIPGLATLVTS